MKKYNTLRFLFYWFYTFFAIGIPIILVSEKYALVVAKSQYKATGMGIIMAVVVLFYFRSQLKDMVENMDEGNAKTLCKESLRVFPILLLYFALQFAEVQMSNFKFIVLWSFVSNIIGVLFQMQHYKYLKIAKEQRKVINND